MNNIFQRPPEHRLVEWKNFRESLDNSLDDFSYLSEITEFWSSAPIVHYSFDFDKKEWPSPWELLVDGYFCRSAISYLMAKTVEFNKTERWQKQDIKLIYIKDLLNSDQYWMVVVADCYVLGFEHGKVNYWDDIKQFCEIYDIRNL